MAYKDPNLLVQKMNREYDVRDPTLKKYVESAKELARSFEQLQIKKLPRTLNFEVDLLSKVVEYQKFLSSMQQ